MTPPHGLSLWWGVPRGVPVLTSGPGVQRVTIGSADMAGQEHLASLHPLDAAVQQQNGPQRDGAVGTQPLKSPLCPPPSPGDTPPSLGTLTPGSQC